MRLDEPACNARLASAAPDLARTALSLYQRVEDAEAATALTVERIVKLAEATAEEDRAEERRTDGYFTSTQGLLMFAETVRALASDTGKAALAALRAERDRWKTDAKFWENRENEAVKRAEKAEAERDTLAASLAAAQAEVTALRALLKRCRPSVANMAYGWPEDDVLVQEVDAALAAHDSRNDKEGG